MRKEGVTPNAVTLRSVLLALENAPPPEMETRGRISTVPNWVTLGDEGEEETATTPSSTPVRTGDMGDRYSPVPAFPWEIAISLLEESASVDGDSGNGVEEGGFPSPRDFASVLTAAFFGDAGWPSIVKVRYLSSLPSMNGHTSFGSICTGMPSRRGGDFAKRPRLTFLLCAMYLRIL